MNRGAVQGGRLKMEIVRTLDKVEGDKVTIRTTTLSTDVSTIDEIKQFFEGRKLQLQKLDSKYFELKKKLNELNIKVTDSDLKKIQKFEKDNAAIIEKWGIYGIKEKIKFELQGIEIEREKFKKDILQIQSLLNKVENEKK